MTSISDTLSGISHKDKLYKRLCMSVLMEKGVRPDNSPESAICQRAAIALHQLPGWNERKTALFQYLLSSIKLKLCVGMHSVG